MELKKLKEREEFIVNRIYELQSSPPTRMSAYGGIMIHEARIIREWENLDEELGKLEAQIYSLENPNQTSEIELVYCDDNYVVETHIKNGILIKGGLLESYFKGRVATEHHEYVIGRHDKQYYKLLVNNVILYPNEPFTSGVATIDCLIGDFRYLGKCDYNSRVNEKTYFYFNISNIDIHRENSDRGLSTREKQLLKYVCAMCYRDIYKPNCNINLVN